MCVFNWVFSNSADVQQYNNECPLDKLMNWRYSSCGLQRRSGLVRLVSGVRGGREADLLVTGIEHRVETFTVGEVSLGKSEVRRETHRKV